ncbi:MAG: hypothetical protein RLZZ136_1139, partial [Pseudomonadota bacterium]
YHFDGELAAVTASDFITDWLIHRAGARGVVTGEDFTFGKGRDGNVAELQKLGAAHGITARAVSAVTDDHGPMSSSRIRAALKAGNCAEATRLLTRPFTIRGIVQHGDKNGRKLGFPTANIAMDGYLRPLYGIYAVRGRLADGTVLNGAANLGIRPSFDPPKELLEPHFFDFSGDLYGQEIDVEFIQFIRPEAKYEGLEALMDQIAKDCAEARRILEK